MLLTCPGLVGRDPGAHSVQLDVPINASLEMQLRLQYAMTIIRLVNGIADSSQKKKVASSVAALAASAGESHCVPTN